MVDSSAAAAPPLRRGDARRAAILDAAIDEFSANGIRGASMARIASGAGVSRPALYQYFANRDDIFASAFISLFEGHRDRAVAALAGPGPTADRLDGFLQRFDGDLWEQLAASPHADEIVDAKTGQVTAGVMAVIEELHTSLAEWLAEAAPGDDQAARTRRQHWLDVLTLSPKGLRSDHPPVDRYRHRLTALARSIAADMAGDMADDMAEDAADNAAPDRALDSGSGAARTRDRGSRRPR